MVRVRAIHPRDLDCVRHVVAAKTAVHRARQRQPGGRADQQVPDVPDPRRVRVRSRCRPVSDERQLGRIRFGHLHQRHILDADIGDNDRVDHFGSEVGRRGRNRLRQPEVARIQVHACIYVQVGLPGEHREGVGLSRDRIRLAVDRRVGSHVLQRELVIRRQEEFREKRAGADSLRQPHPVGIRARERREVGVAVVNIDQHIAEPGLARILQAVPVPIIPYAVADGHIHLVAEEHHAAADQVQPAEIGRRGSIGREVRGIRHVGPVRAVRRNVVRGERVAVDEVVGLEPQVLPTHEHAGQGLRIDIGRGMLWIAAFRVPAQDHRIQRDAGVAPVRVENGDGVREHGRLAARIQPGDRRNLEPVVAAAVHDEESALADVVVDREPVGEDVVYPLDVVVVPVAVALVREHVVGAAVDDRASKRFFHRGRVGRLQMDIRARDRVFLVKDDVVFAGNDGVVHSFDVDDLRQQNEVVGVRADLES
ncbi:MAG: hypothetical protein BWY59_00072 [Verrucomicrobia bacterium ADurb.Bin345]|nr:MAG: hypothetical protein BWY59_00072 [Verrucomicrobia bacterium ADurb.Bin345]